MAATLRSFAVIPQRGYGICVLLSFRSEAEDSALISAQMPNPDLLSHLQALEESLLQHWTRQNQTLVESLLTEDFREFGSSGRSYSRQQILKALAAESPQSITAHDYKLTMLSPEAALLTYTSIQQPPDGSPMKALRSSIWVHRDGNWRMLFHQGTPTA